MASAPAVGISGTYLTFHVADEEYGIEILKVREIIGMLPITPVPGSSSVMHGVVNLRGKVIPVLSMRRRFAMPVVEAHEHNVIIVVDAGDGQQIGLAVDRVREVAKFSEADTEPPPTYGMAIDSGLVAALGKSQGRIRLLLNLEQVLQQVG